MNDPTKRDAPSVLADTIAEMTYPELEGAIAEGAVALWALGVIEEHGPHLPLATDVYLPSATLRQVRRRLEHAGQRAVIVPPFYWGVNSVTNLFTGSFVVRPEIVHGLIVDVLASLDADGLPRVFCLSGHNDSAHNQTVAAAIEQARGECDTDARFVIDQTMCGYMGLNPRDAHILTYPLQYPQGKYMDIHAGEGETSMIWSVAPSLLREEIASGLKPTELSLPDLMRWRQGGEQARRTTPDGYFGDPAAGDPDRGAEMIDVQADGVATAILAALAAETAENRVGPQ